MQETGIINVEKRLNTTSGENRRLREKGYLPVILYGKEVESTPLTVKKSELKSSLIKYGKNAVFNINLPGENTYSIIVKDIQNDPITEDFIHADFQQISLTEEIKMDVPIRIVGREVLESARLLIIQQADNVTVKCLPNNVPQSIEIDVSSMNAGDNVSVGDITLPEGVSLDSDPEQVILTLTEAKEHITEDEEQETEEGSEQESVESSEDAEA